MMTTNEETTSETSFILNVHWTTANVWHKCVRNQQLSQTH
jgi:hypothetical protein